MAVPARAVGGPLTQGEWQRVVNWASERAGGIHHDETARAKGFPAGLVPGDVHVSMLTAAIVDRVGPAWYEHGWLQQTFVTAAYTGDEARALVEGDDDRHLVLSLERRDGTVLCAGHAGVDPDGPAPWAPIRDDGGDPLPHEPVGTAYPEVVETFTRADVDRSIDGIDPSPWYRTESPWGGPVVPTVGVFNAIHRTRATPMPKEIGRAMRAGMNARFEAVHLAPIRFDVPYVRRAHLAAKGIGGRYASRTVELSYTEAASGLVAFRGRWRIKWVHSASSPASASST